MSEIITFVCSYKMHPNMEGELNNFGKMLGEEFNLHLIIGKDQCPDYLKKNFKVFEYSKPTFEVKGLSFGLKSCFKYLKSENPNIIINTAMPFPIGLAMLTTATFFNVKTVFRITGNYFSEWQLYPNPIKKFRKWIVFSKMLNVIYRNADYVLTIGDNLRKYALKAGFDEETVVAIPQPFNQKDFKPTNKAEKNNLKNDLGLETDKETILFVGRHTTLKGIDRIYNVVKHISKDQILKDRYQFCLIGSGNSSQFLNFPTDLVKIPGKVARNDIAKYYKASNILIHPSRSEGSCPNVIFEAIAASLPVLASPISDIPKYVPNLAKDWEDYIGYLTEGSFEHSSKPTWFNWDCQTKIYKNYFKNILDGN